MKELDKQETEKEKLLSSINNLSQTQNQIIKKILKEATGDSSGGRGSYIAPVQPGLRPWSGESLQPFSQAVSDYKSPLVQYDSYDHTWDLRRKDIEKLEKTASKIQDYIKRDPYATFSDEDGNVINQFMVDGKHPKYSEMMAPFTVKIPFNEYRFAVITYEHDYYLDQTKSYRDLSREYLESKGYILICGNIAPDEWRVYEDWWVNPELVSLDIINKMKRWSEDTISGENYILSGE